MGELLKGKVAVVTGSGQGLGAGIARGLAGEGARVITNNRKPGTEGGDAETVARAIRDAGGEAFPCFGDVASFQDCERLIKTAVDKFGRIDILVNLAGILRDRMIWNMSEEEFDSVIAVHLKGTWNTCRHAAGLMRQQRSGRIINTSSRVAFGNPGQSNYGSAKAGIIGLTTTVARELGRYGVTCNAFMPLAATRFSVTPEVAASKEKRAASGVQTSVQLGEIELPPPEDVAPLVVYLASDAAANVNGQVFFACGGEITHWAMPAPRKSIFATGRWTPEEIAAVFPGTLGKDLVNPAPPAPPAPAQAPK